MAYKMGVGGGVCLTISRTIRIYWYADLHAQR